MSVYEYLRFTAKTRHRRRDVPQARAERGGGAAGRAHVERHQRGIILGGVAAGQKRGRIEHVVVEDVRRVWSKERAQKQDRDGRLNPLEANYLLLDSILIDAEVIRFEAGDELAGLLQQHASHRGSPRGVRSSGINWARPSGFLKAGAAAQAAAFPRTRAF